jgi:hypothetical protein
MRRISFIFGWRTITLILLLIAASAENSIALVNEPMDAIETQPSLDLSVSTGTAETNITEQYSDIVVIETQYPANLSITTDVTEINTSESEKTKTNSSSSCWFNVSGIFNTFLGAFLGVLLSVCLNDRLRKNRRKKCIDNIALELKDIKNALQEHKKTPTPILSYAIYTPIWEAVVGNGDILELIKEPYYDDLFLVYAHINKLSKMENFAIENDELDCMIGIQQQRAYIIKLLSSRIDFPYEENFEEHKLYPLLEKYAK